MRKHMLALAVLGGVSVAAGCGALAYYESCSEPVESASSSAISIEGGGSRLTAESPMTSHTKPLAAAAESSSDEAASASDESEREMVRVPSVIGMTRSQAKKLLAQAGSWKTYKVRGTKGGFDDGSRAIVGQKPAAGEMHPRGEKVYVSFPPAPMLTVPSIVGMTENEARTAVRAAKFSTRYIKRTDRTIVEQTPAAGEQAPQGSGIKVVLK